MLLLSFDLLLLLLKQADNKSHHSKMQWLASGLQDNCLAAEVCPSAPKPTIYQLLLGPDHPASQVPSRSMLLTTLALVVISEAPTCRPVWVSSGRTYQRPLYCTSVPSSAVLPLLPAAVH